MRTREQHRPFAMNVYCPRCQAGPGDPCQGKQTGRPVVILTRPHRERAAEARRLQPPGECGTYAGWNRHVKNGETPCGPCRKANAAYVRERRQRDPEARAKDYRASRIHSRALWILADRHRDEFRAVVAELTNEELAS